MNGFERMNAVLHGEAVDYTPSMEIMIDDKVIRALTGSTDYMDFCEYIDLDAVITTTPSTLYRNKVIDGDKGLFVNEWGITRQQGVEVVSAIVDCPMKSPEDVFAYQAPDPLDEYRFTYLRALVKRFKGKRLIGMHVHDAFNYPYYLMGMEELFIAMYEEPEAVHKLVELSVAHNIALARKAVEIGADFILLGDDYGAHNQLLVSPAMFREFFLPGFNQVVSAIKELGVYCFKHCCGNINEILDDMVASGIDVLHPLDPSAGMDILAVKEKYKKLVVMGGINCYKPLCEYSTEQMAQETQDVIKTIGQGGRFIIASSNSVHSDAKPENYLTMQNVRKSILLSSL